MVATIGVSLLLLSLATVFFGATPQTAITPWTLRYLQFGPISLSYQRALVVIGTLAALVVLQQFITRTKMGKAMRAVSQNREACRPSVSTFKPPLW